MCVRAHCMKRGCRVLDNADFLVLGFVSLRRLEYATLTEEEDDAEGLQGTRGVTTSPKFEPHANSDEDDGSDTKSGSHNLVLGTNNSYESYGGIVSGDDNRIYGMHAIVLAAQDSNATGDMGIVLPEGSSGGTDRERGSRPGEIPQTQQCPGNVFIPGDKA